MYKYNTIVRWAVVQVSMFESQPRKKFQMHVEGQLGSVLGLA